MNINQNLDMFFKEYDLEQAESAIADWYLDNSIKTGSQDKMNKFIQKAFAIHPEKTSYWLASAFKQQHNFKDASAYYLKAFELNPDNRKMWWPIESHLLRHGEPEEVKQYYNGILSIIPDNTAPQFFLKAYDYFESLVNEILKCVDSKRDRSCRRPILLITLVFWGPKYSDIFLNYLLPILLAEGNLPGIYTKHEIHFLVITSDEDAGRLEADWSYKEVAKYAKMHVIRFQEEMLNYVIAYSKEHERKLGWCSRIPLIFLTNVGHYAALESGRILDGDILFLWPDTITTNSILSGLSTIMSGDISAIAVAGFRLYHNQDMLSELNMRYRSDTGLLSIPPEEMIKVLLRFLPEPNFADAKEFSTVPVYLCWKVPHEGIIVHINHYAPCVIRGSYLDGPLYPSLDPVDGFFLSRKLRSTDKMVIAPKDMLWFDMSDNPLISPLNNQTFDPTVVADWLRQWLTPVHERYFRNCLQYNLSEVTSARWDSTIAMADRIVNNIILSARGIQ